MMGAHWIWVLRQITLNEVFALIGSQAEQDVNLINVAAVEADWMTGLGCSVTKGEEVVRHRRRAGQLSSRSSHTHLHLRGRRHPKCATVFVLAITYFGGARQAKQKQI